LKNIKNAIKNTIGIGLGVLLIPIVVYAVVRLFYSQSITSNFGKKEVFTFDLSADMPEVEVGPGDSVSVSPVITNTATEQMVVFIDIETPSYEGESIYTIEPSDGWTLVEEAENHEVFAYGKDEMTILYQDEATDALTDKITMKEISNGAYAAIDDINVTITGYGIDTESTYSSIEEAWERCKAMIE
jgi:hypothetical protein